MVDALPFQHINSPNINDRDGYHAIFMPDISSPATCRFSPALLHLLVEQGGGTAPSAMDLTLNKIFQDVLSKKVKPSRRGPRVEHLVDCYQMLAMESSGLGCPGTLGDAINILMIEEPVGPRFIPLARR
jgi:hypothetical protein